MSSSPLALSLDLAQLRRLYETTEWTPARVIEAVYTRIENCPRSGIWIALASKESALAAAVALQEKDRAKLPLYGVPFAVKDNIDVAGVPTTAACPAFSYTPETNAHVVQKLLDAGAIFIGKTNMDQFAAGLVGTRSPYGACQNAFHPEYISGGSSSGSAVAVATGLVSFALGTDTAGSGRVPAAFNNLVGYKPTRGMFSTQGVVPACRSLDCVSVFSLNVADALQIANIAEGYDPRAFAPRARTSGVGFDAARFRFGVPAKGELRFFGNADAERIFHEAQRHLEVCGGTRVEIDYAPFRKAAELLYGGPWVAERYAGIAPFFKSHAEDIHPVTRGIIGRGDSISGADVFDGLYALDALRTLAAREWAAMDVMLLPTAGTIYTQREVEADPVALNTNLGYYTNFVNLLDCVALALPAGFVSNGLPLGITLIAPAFCDASLFHLGRRFEARASTMLGATGISLSQEVLMEKAREPGADEIRLAVVGAHLKGQPLNRELTDLNAQLVWSGKTAPLYRFFALNTTPPKPGMLRVETGGAAIDVEVWSLMPAAFGTFVANVPAPMAIGTMVLETGESVKGFLCEPAALTTARDITHYGGWRAFRAQSQA
jgi:allophanate hydrolase